MASYSVNAHAIAQARRLIDAHQYVLESVWGDAQPTADDENAFLESHSWSEYAGWHLGLTDGASDDTKARYAFVYGDFRRVHRMGLIACQYRAAEWRHKEIELAAHELLQYLDKARAREPLGGCSLPRSPAIVSDRGREGAALVIAVLLQHRERKTEPAIPLLEDILVQGIALLWLSTPGGYIPVEAIDAAAWEWASIPWAFAFLALFALGLELTYRRTTLGEWYRAVGSRAIAAGRLGVPTNTIRYVAYASAGLLGAAAGVFFAMTIGIGDPALGVTFTLASISAVVLGGLSTWGGRGSWIGPIAGALMLGLIANASSFFNLPSQTQLYMQGGLLLLSIAIYFRLRASGTTRDEVVAR